jgi:hypothetical protein
VTSASAAEHRGGALAHAFSVPHEGADAMSAQYTVDHGLIDSSFAACWYAHRTVRLAIGEAATAFDVLAVHGTGAEPLPSVHVLSGPTSHDVSRSPWLPVRSYVARIRPAGCLRAVATEVSLTPWSATITEIGARPLTTRVPSVRADRYWMRVHDLLDDLKAKVESIARVGRAVGYRDLPQVVAALAA